MVSEPPQPWPSPAAIFSPPCLPSSVVPACSRLLPPSLPFLPSMLQELPGAKQKNNKKPKKKKVDKLINIENSLAICSNWVIAAIDIIWLQRNALMAGSLVLPIESFRPTIFPLVYVAKTVASGAIDVFRELSKIAPPPSPFPLFPWRTLDPTPSLRLRPPPPRPSFVLKTHPFDRLCSDDDLLLSSPFPAWFGTGLPPSLAILDLRSATVSSIIPFSLGRTTGLSVLSLTGNSLSGDIPATLGGLRHLTHLNLSCNALSESIPPALAALSNLSLLDRSVFSCLEPLAVATCPATAARRHLPERRRSSSNPSKLLGRHGEEEKRKVRRRSEEEKEKKRSKKKEKKRKEKKTRKIKKNKNKILSSHSLLLLECFNYFLSLLLSTFSIFFSLYLLSTFYLYLLFTSSMM